ncbi:thymidylate synthase [Cytobacillus oceanisediminis]|uniref:thymidylate synthase n=1 Tax=Cytobacillus oceanisediminis TaxID=665099 RepID=UPI001C23E27B|nr:thymidylate synthase [Cytobacillus oceanisediminis]MBU8772162.1 thymidylate synthase [Cytobacillus oceanisediminis]
MTKRIFGVVYRYDLSKEFPAPILRPVPLKTCFDEVDSTYRQRSNNAIDFRGKIGELADLKNAYTQQE